MVRRTVGFWWSRRRRTCRSEVALSAANRASMHRARTRRRCLLAAIASQPRPFVAATPYATAQRPATLVLDASRAADGIMDVHERIPARAGSVHDRLSEVDSRRTRADRPAQRSGRAADLRRRQRRSTGVAIRSISTRFTSTFRPARRRSTSTSTC